MKILGRISPDERMDLEDMAAIAGTLELFEAMRQGRTLFLPAGRNVGAAATEARIFDGFLVTDAGGGVALVTAGSGFFKLEEEGVTYMGIMLSTDCGDATHSLDLSGEPNDDYNIWVRPIFVDSDSENRVFWNAGGAPAAEYVDHPNTRRSLVWETTYRSTSDAAPTGDAWLIAAVVTIAAGAIAGIADYRHFFFEGDAAAGAYTSEWGAGTDRNVDRATYGIKDWHRFAQMVRQQFASIIGAAYYTAPDPTLADLAAEHHTDGQHLDVHATSLVIDDRAGAPTTSNYTMASRLLAGMHRLTMLAADAPATGEASIRIADAGNVAQYVQNPRGEAAALQVADYGEVLCLGPDDGGRRYGIRSTITVVGSQYSHAFGELSGTPPLRVDQGGAAANMGAYLTEAGARYFHTSRTEDFWAEWNWNNSGVATNWTMAVNGAMYCNLGHLGETAWMSCVDWPEGMTLNGIDITVILGGATANLITFTAYRETYVPGGFSPTTAVLGAASTGAAGITELTIAPVASSGWTHETHRLILVVTASDQTNQVFMPRINYTATTVSRYAQ